MVWPSSYVVATMTATVAVAGAATYFGLQSFDDSGKDDPAETGESQTEPFGGREVIVCVRLEDQMLRVPPGFAESCPAGHEQLRLPEEDEQLCDLCDPFEEEKPQTGQAAIALLEKRIQKLENLAYFEVVTREVQKPIFSIGPHITSFFPEEGSQAVAIVGAGQPGAHFTARSLTEGTEVSIGASGTRAGTLFFDGGVKRIEMGRRDGPFGLRFPSGDGLMAGIGESRAGSGAAVIGTLLGAAQGTIMVPDDRGVVSLGKKAGTISAVFGEPTIGGGVLDLGDGGGNSFVKMGHNGHNYGIVMAGPVLGVPYVPRTGVPGSFFVGCASGQSPACIPEVAER